MSGTTVIHRHGGDVAPIVVQGSVYDVQAKLRRARQNDPPFAWFDGTDGSQAHISPDSVDWLEAVE